MIDPTPLPMSLEDYDQIKPPEGELYELHDGYIVAFSTGSGRHIRRVDDRRAPQRT